jgi:hypothetical protein
MNKVMFRILLLCFVFAFIGCKHSQDRVRQEWTGKTISLPNISPVYAVQKDSVIFGKEYKILVYTDPMECLSCKFRVYLWQKYIKEAGSRVDFLFYFYPENEEELLSMLKNGRFKYPIYIDRNDDLNKLNKLPRNPAFHCFLLDKDNKILALGNPVTTPNVWEMFKKIMGEVKDNIE